MNEEYTGTIGTIEYKLEPLEYGLIMAVKRSNSDYVKSVTKFMREYSGCTDYVYSVEQLYNLFKSLQISVIRLTSCPSAVISSMHEAIRMQDVMHLNDPSWRKSDIYKILFDSIATSMVLLQVYDPYECKNFDWFVSYPKIDAILDKVFPKEI